MIVTISIRKGMSGMDHTNKPTDAKLLELVKKAAWEVDLKEYDLERFESEKRTEEKRKKLNTSPIF